MSRANHVARAVARLEPDDVLGLQAKSRLGLRRDGVRSAEGVEVIHVERA